MIVWSPTPFIVGKRYDGPIVTRIGEQLTSHDQPYLVLREATLDEFNA